MSLGVPETFHSRSEQDTRQLARTLAAHLKPGAVVLLQGDLGAGKTAFVKGLAEGLAIDPIHVSSPTFVLIQEYRGRYTLYHVDLYRLQPEEVRDLGLEEMMAGDGIVAIEWPERIREEVPGAVRVVIRDEGGDERRVTISWPADTRPSVADYSDR